MPANTPAPIVLVILAALLISCNVFWLYTTPDNTTRSVCGHLIDTWSGSARRSKDAVNASVAALPGGVRDYQVVRGSGLSDVPFPIPIPNDTLLLGEDVGRDDGLRQRYLTIGIASVWRKEEYLHRTLDSLLRETSGADQRDVFIFLLLADADADIRLARARAIESRYRQHITAGVIRVLQPPAVLYPSIDFTAIRRTYNDSVSRVQWRTKQVLDFAFLFWYTWARQPSTYYLILEDDVLAARHFVTAVRDFVRLHSKREWVALQLSGFMGIGQLIRCKDLDRLVSFLLLFYKEHPVDVLFNHWVSMMVPQKPPKDIPYRRVPGLFQHVGIHSTLANKTQTLRDSTFSLVKRRFSHVNPPAEVVTTIRQYKSFVAPLAYSSAPGLFWGVPRAGDTYDIVLTTPLIVTRIVIITGATVSKKKTRDRLLFGQLQVSPLFERMLSPNRAQCKNFVAIQEFSNGEVDVKDINERFERGIQCIRVVIGSKQRTWISISEIAVFTENPENTNTVSDPVKRDENNLIKSVPSVSISSASTTSSKIYHVTVSAEKSIIKSISSKAINDLHMTISPTSISKTAQGDFNSRLNSTKSTNITISVPQDPVVSSQNSIIQAGREPFTIFPNKHNSAETEVNASFREERSVTESLVNKIDNSVNKVSEKIINASSHDFQRKKQIVSALQNRNLDLELEKLRVIKKKLQMQDLNRIGKTGKYLDDRRMLENSVEELDENNDDAMILDEDPSPESRNRTERLSRLHDLLVRSMRISDAADETE
ncbi:uncharacterized protein LOC108665683 [Hyalella azteca]|uniref:Uncharacterized protein LOC108665683 n=1 Tax=Hyalella azteca TaxID=294128 RepID=A0A8B7N3Y4_HYAAZ|nr:uncharacterized protein LOC108665683 [Hyalella azteca]